MKKILLSILLLFASTMLVSAQFQVTVELRGDCIEPDENTNYVVKFYIYNSINDELVDTSTETVLTTYAGNPVYITTQFSNFCTSDNTKIYKIYAEAAKVYQTYPITEICYGKKWTSILYSCSDFVFNSPISIGFITLE